MTDPTPATFLARLGLLPDVIGNRNLPAGIDGTSIIAALEAAAADLAPAPGLTPSGDLHPGHVLRIVAGAAKALLADPERRHEAVYLTEQARADQTDSAALAHIRILALAQLGDRARLIAEVDRLLAQDPPDRRLQEILQQFATNHKLVAYIAARSANHTWLWGEMPATLRGYLSSLQPNNAALGSISQRLIDFTFEQRSDRQMTPEDFYRRLFWGARSFAYLKFLRHSTAHIHAEQKSGKPLSGADHKVLALFDEINSVVIAPDLRPLQQARDAGHSIVIADSHAGTSLVSNLGTAALNMPGSLISTKAGYSWDPRNFNIATSGPDVHTQFLKLTKLLKKEQRLVRIVPDGGEGALLDFELFGRPIKLGQGAASLAYHGRAAVFFVHSRWDGHHFNLSFKTGPVASPNQTRPAFDAAFYDFYLGCLREIVSGAPEDMGLNGGFWRFFR